MRIIGYVFGGIATIVLLVALAFGLELFDLQWEKFFSPRRQNIQRQVFEETQSYVHGKIQDLAKYFEEYQKSDSSQERDAIRAVIQLRFAEFDENNVRADNLRRFLIDMRGF